MTLLALAALALGPKVTRDPIDNWVTLPESNMQVELHLHKSGKFEAHEYWTGPQSKPMPNFAMRGTWTKDGQSIVLEIKTTYCPMGGIVPQKEKTLPIRGVHLFWMDVLHREHSLSKTKRKPEKIEFGREGGRLAVVR